MQTDQNTLSEQQNSEEKSSDLSPFLTKKRQKSSSSPALDIFIDQSKSFDDPEKKIRNALEFMRGSLSQVSQPRFKDFWEAKKLCLSFFKENVSAKVRADLWESYIEVSLEGGRLKEILEEQSSFAVEQIDLAIKALEADLEHYEQLLNQIDIIDFPSASVVFQEKKEVYNKLQRELHLLNNLASRINSLRKEVVKTEMRVRQKTKFFERLSKSGDWIFPRRKELIQTVSTEFLTDVELFIRDSFHEDIRKMPPLYILKEEIKALQAIAKMLTLNTHSFTETRLRLSECWDKARHLEKERKKEIAEKRVVFKQNYDVALVKIREFEQLVNTENLSSAELQRSFDEIGEYLRNIPLGRDEILSIREVFKPIRSVVLEKLKEEENERETELRKKEDSHKEIVSQLRKAIESLISKADSSTLETLVAEQSKLCAQYQEMSVNQAEKNQLDHLFKRLKDTVSDKEERVLLSTEDFNALEKLRDALNERKRLRAQIKSQLESYRKVLSESGFDFEKAMEIRETVENEKIRLDKVNGAISDIEDKIASLEA